MADYDFYKNKYFGTVIPDKPSFNSAAGEAAAFVDSIISNRELLTKEDILTKYNKAVCAAADEIYKQITVDEKPQKQNESVGNHSVSYSIKSISFEERQAIMNRKVRLYLAGTGLLYRGLK